jgi:hypothetical protein
VNTSNWFHLKEKAVNTRKNGVSIRNIEKQLGIPRSTLSGWFKNIKLSRLQKQKLINDNETALVRARKIAIEWHHQQKENNLKKAQEEALSVLSHLDTNNTHQIELALAMLYLGEGTKHGSTVLGSSDVLILKFYVKCLTKLFHLNQSTLKCDLHLRGDQNAEILKLYWSKILNIPKKNFNAYLDRRTLKSNTFPSYKGVCVVRCGNIAIQRRMLYLSREFCRKVSNAGG